jgi:hypothetical protein
MAALKGLTCENMVALLNGGSEDDLYFDDESDTFGSDVSDKDSESDSNNVSAVTFILHLFPKRRNEWKWTPIRPLSERSKKLPYISISQINPAVYRQR